MLTGDVITMMIADLDRFYMHHPPYVIDNHCYYLFKRASAAKGTASVILCYPTLPNGVFDSIHDAPGRVEVMMVTYRCHLLDTSSRHQLSDGYIEDSSI